MTHAEITYALADIKETMALWINTLEDDAYVAKLLREWDDLVALKQKMGA